MGEGLFRRLAHRQHVHAVDLHNGDAVGLAAVVALGRLRGGALDRGAHAVLVVLDDVDHRQRPHSRHVEGPVYRKSVVYRTSVSVRVDSGGRRVVLNTTSVYDTHEDW